MEKEEELELSGWLRVIVSQMRLRADVEINPNTAGGLRGWAKDIEVAADMIEQNNIYVRSACGEKASCGYAGRERRCPTCPMEYLLFWPEKAAEKSKKKEAGG